MLNPKRHIANHKTLEQYECCICYELTQDIRSCKGPCEKPYCLKCIGRIRYNNDICPSKCSQPFLTQPIHQFKLQYQCPYNPQNCKQLFQDLQRFRLHCSQCIYKTAQGEKEVANKQKFQCDKGHKLQLVTLQLLNSMNKSQTNFYTLVMNDLCSGCGGRNLCRSICVPCSQQTRHVYCVECRQFPFTKQVCPKGHPYIYKTITSLVSVCDGCGISALLYGKVAHTDHICDIVLCERCYEQLPDFVEKKHQQQQKQKVELSLQKLLLQLNSQYEFQWLQ